MTILVLGGIKGGAGKSTLAANIAVNMARSRSVLLVDADSQGTSTTWAAARAENDLGLAPVTTISITGKHIHTELVRLCEHYDLIVVDVGGRDSTTQRSALLVANVVALPFPPRGPDLWTLEAVNDLLGEIRTVNPKLVAVPFVNRADPAGDDNAEAEAAFAEFAETMSPSPARVGNRKRIAVAHLAGLAVREERRPDPKAVEEIDALCQYLFHTETVRI